MSELKIMTHLGPHLNIVNLLGACTKSGERRGSYKLKCCLKHPARTSTLARVVCRRLRGGRGLWRALWWAGCLLGKWRLGLADKTILPTDAGV